MTLICTKILLLFSHFAYLHGRQIKTLIIDRLSHIQRCMIHCHVLRTASIEIQIRQDRELLFPDIVHKASNGTGEFHLIPFHVMQCNLYIVNI